MSHHTAIVDPVACVGFGEPPARLPNDRRIALADLIGAFYFAVAQDHPRRALRAERRLAAVLHRDHFGQTFAWCGYTWSVDSSTPAGRVRVVRLVELDQ